MQAQPIRKKADVFNTKKATLQIVRSNEDQDTVKMPLKEKPAPGILLPPRTIFNTSYIKCKDRDPL